MIESGRRLRPLLGPAAHPVSDHTNAMILGRATIRAFSRVPLFIERYSDLADNSSKVGVHIIIGNSWSVIRSGALGCAFVVTTAAAMVHSNIDAATAGFTITLALQMKSTLSKLLGQVSTIRMGITAAYRVIAVTEVPTEPGTGRRVADWPSQGTRIGIVGRTGAGKSSLTNALLRFVPVTGGRILIDGVNIAEVYLHQLRSTVRLIPQDPVLFSGTLRANIDPFTEKTDAQVQSVLERVRLVHANQTSEKSAPALSLKTNIESGGNSLSHGQRQLVCLARAILARCRVLVLDEATSGMDEATDEAIQEIIGEDFGDATVIVVAHKLLTVAGFDKIVVMSEGRVVESRSPAELLEKKCLFWEMVTYDLISDQTDASTKFRLAVKDNIATAGLPTQCASSILAAHASPFEATIVRQLRDRGARVVGKTNMDEFGMGSHSMNSIHGAVRNPLSEEGEPLSAGGSSGGSAVAVRLGDADVALGTDTGGSVRLPAAYTGVVGYKPSYGMLSRFGVVPYANSLDTVGLLAKDVLTIQGVVFATNLYTEHDPNDPTSLSAETRRRCAEVSPSQLPPLRDITIGIPTEYNIEELEPAVREAWASTAAKLEAQGVRIVSVSLPSTKEALCAYYVLAPAEATSNLAKYDGVRYGVRGGDGDAAGDTLYSEARGAGFGAEVRRRILLGTYSLSSEAIDNYFLQAQRVRRRVRQDFDEVFRAENPLCEPRQFDLCEMPEELALADKQGPAQVDFLLCPTAPSLPPALRELETRNSVDAYTSDVFTVPASLAGLPAVSVPVWPEENRFPVGMQLIAQYWDDQRLLHMAAKLQEAMSS
ncbi:Amidase signature domain protein [Cordyceps fumosorosea ARSEF 2679]|uniref:Glutamyl-tRNA(Gln) amidotransferase subunit A, mitochondrial n=1 Tax=Cordyceps fumosorosea (strain ARSEF 2679) TaxID=1081104 RepID=A0A162ME59_CORFA|nr:Amidase signature domain protein [Cordyceps fumosorosea ARSEF 2679]OAA54930.1 Amidase signature domain protein [Cordyceps fumosorosea ARSEF 2679]